MNFKKTILITILGLIFLSQEFCIAKGPVYKNLPVSIAFPVEGRFRFKLRKGAYFKNLAGEVIFEKNTASSPKKTYFKITTVGLNLGGAIREHVYEGLAYLTEDNIVELRSDRCYLFGKKDWEDRMVPLERWDCDHIFLTFKSDTNFTKREKLERVITNRTKKTEWMKIKSLTPMPLPLNKITLKNQIYFAGQVLPISIEEDDLAIVWGENAGRLLRDGQLLNVQDEVGLDVGKLKVLSRPGDFAICKWVSKIPKEKAISVAFAIKANWEK